MLLSGTNPGAAFRSGRQLHTAHTIDRPADSGPEKAGAFHAAEILEKQLHRWKDEGGALLPDANSDSSP